MMIKWCRMVWHSLMSQPVLWLGDIVSTIAIFTLFFDKTSFSVKVTLVPLAFATWIVNVAYDSLGVDGTITVASYMIIVYSCTRAFNPSI